MKTYELAFPLLCKGFTSRESALAAVRQIQGMKVIDKALLSPGSRVYGDDLPLEGVAVDAAAYILSKHVGGCSVALTGSRHVPLILIDGVICVGTINTEGEIREALDDIADYPDSPEVVEAVLGVLSEEGEAELRRLATLRDDFHREAARSLAARLETRLMRSAETAGQLALA